MDLAPLDVNTRIQLSRLFRKLENGPKGRKNAIELLVKGVEEATKSKSKSQPKSKSSVVAAQAAGNLKSILEELIDLYILNGDMTGADDCVWKLLEIDPTNEMALRSVHSTVEWCK